MVCRTPCNSSGVWGGGRPTHRRFQCLGFSKCSLSGPPNNTNYLSKHCSICIFERNQIMNSLVVKKICGHRTLKSSIYWKDTEDAQSILVTPWLVMPIKHPISWSPLWRGFLYRHRYLIVPGTWPIPYPLDR